MSAQILDGKQIAAELKSEIKNDVEKLKTSGIVPGLATLLVGENSASQIYVKNKHRACQDVGIASFNHTLPKESDTESVLDKVEQLNSDPQVNGILVQLPLPSQIDTEKILSSIQPEKDVDGFHPYNLGRLFGAKDLREITEHVHPVPIPCTPQGIIHLIQKTGNPISGKNSVVIGRSTIVGKPVAALLLALHSTVTVAHSRTKNLKECCLNADILVAAVGQVNIITGEMVKKGAIVIDVGINRNADGTLCGDVHFASAKENAGWITPVPGGVGPMTIVMLLKNTVQLANQSKHNREKLKV